MCAHNNGDDVPHGTIAAAQNPLQIVGHLAIWATGYSVGVAIILGEFLVRPIGFLALAYVALCAHSGYLFDRVKFRDADLDPADLMADPDRHLFLRRFSRSIRILMVVEWIGAVAVGGVISPVLGAVVIGGIVAGYVYSGWRPMAGGRWVRLKDIAGFKAVMVGGAVVGLGLIAVLGEALPRSFGALGRVGDVAGGVPWILIVGMLVMVCGDAVICDLDDQESDEKYRTRSLPVMIGMRRSALVASGLLVTGGLMVALDAGENVQARALFAGMAVVSGLGIMRQGKDFGGRRDWIDGRMLMVVICVMIVNNYWIIVE